MRFRTVRPMTSPLRLLIIMLSATFFLAVSGYSAAHMPSATRSPFAAKALATVSKHALVKENKCAPSEELPPNSGGKHLFSLTNRIPFFFHSDVLHLSVHVCADCEWFGKGEATVEQAQDLVVQFSVFSNLFLLAQLNKVINAPSLDDMREGKEILANEIGVVFRPPKKNLDTSKGFDPSVVSVAGSVVGGVYNHRAAHFEWLCDVGESMGLSFDDLGKRKHGSESTLHFCDELYRIYGSDDPNVALGASFAIEHWANAGFWDDLVAGFSSMNKKGVAQTPLGFWKFHQALEAQHAAHTMDELEEAYAEGRVTDEVAFEKAANEMLDACQVFWEGLEVKRQELDGYGI